MVAAAVAVGVAAAAAVVVVAAAAVVGVAAAAVVVVLAVGEVVVVAAVVVVPAAVGVAFPYLGGAFPMVHLVVPCLRTLQHSQEGSLVEACQMVEDLQSVGVVAHQKEVAFLEVDLASYQEEAALYWAFLHLKKTKITFTQIICSFYSIIVFTS